jgi:hypothetical protein
LTISFLERRDDGDRAPALGEHDFLAGAHGPNGLREMLIGFPEPGFT